MSAAYHYMCDAVVPLTGTVCAGYYYSTFFREHIVNVCSVRRDYYYMAVKKRDKARDCCDLVILAKLNESI